MSPPARDHEGHDVGALRWRVGRQIGRTLYAMVGDLPDDRDLFIGVMDTADLALHVVTDHNACLRYVEDDES